MAVFVDGDNLACGLAQGIMRIGAEQGEVVLARVYGNLGKLNGWQDAARYSVIHSGTGKNATDLLLSLEAFELALDKRFESCVIASSDGDFSHLAVKLRERGLHVVGTGRPETPAQFREKCSEFVILGGGGAPPQPLAQARVAVARDDLDNWIDVVISERGKDGSMKIVDLNAELRRRHAFCIGEYPERTWKGLIARRSALYQRMPGPEPRLRLRSARSHP